MENNTNTKPIVKSRGVPLKWTPEAIEEEAEFLVEWANRDDSIVIGMCYGERGYSAHEAKDWSEKNQFYSQAKQYAMNLVGARREHMALNKKVDSGIVIRTMRMYNVEYHNFEKERLEHEFAYKKDSFGDDAKNITVVYNDKSATCGRNQVPVPSIPREDTPSPQQWD